MALIQDVMPRGPIALKAFLAEHGLRQKDCAHGVGVPEASVSLWLSGFQRPREAHLRAIEVWTDGAVPASWWLTDEERAEIAKIKPFQPSATPANDPPPSSPRRKPRRSRVAA